MNAMCSKCRFYSGGDSVCRRHPPVVVVASEWDRDAEQYVIVGNTRWPFVEVNDWCGEFKARSE